METSIIAFIFLFFTTTFPQSLSARTLANPPPSSHRDLHRGAHRAITFSMLDVLNERKQQQYPSSKPSTTKIPFSKPLLGYFPPLGGIPLTVPDDSIPMTNLPSQTLDLVEGMTIPFPAIATLQELELGTVTTINEDIYDDQGTLFSSSMLLLGKARGIYVASSEDGTSHMIAMTISFNGEEFKDDGLRFFGIHRIDDESHVAVIGGTGKYGNANGYATIKTVNGSSTYVASDKGDEASYKLLLFNVYLG